MALAILVLALAGVAVAIAWGASRHRRTTPARLLATLGLAIAPTADEGNVKVYALTIANTGSVATTVGSASFEVMDAASHIVPFDWFLQVPQPLPIVLGPGGEWHGLIRADVLRDAVADAAERDPPWRFRASVHDSTGAAHDSDWLTVGPEASRTAEVAAPAPPPPVRSTESRPRKPAAAGRQADSVEVSFRGGTTTLGWTARQELLMRFRQLDSMADVVQAFAKAGRSEPVQLTPDQERKLLRAIENWSLLAGDALPDGIRDLGDALRDDL